MASTVSEAATSIGKTFADGSLKDVPRRINEPSGINPLKFRKLLIFVIKLLILLEFLSAIIEGAHSENWSRLGTDLILAGIVYVMWDRIKAMIVRKKDEYRRRMETSGDAVTLMDALVFSLLWSDEIYTDIPQDMRRLVVIAYTLIAICIGVIFFGIGQGLVGLILCSSLLLAAVNLLAWVVSRERGESEALKTEMRLAHEVQVGLMPKDQPQFEGYDVAGFSLPAKEVGGDHFDYSRVGEPEECFAVSVFDVSGKGMHAAMSAVFTSGAFASELRHCKSVGEILTRLNRSVYTHSRRGHFVSFLVAMLDRSGTAVTFANAGQMKPLHKSGTDLAWLDSVGVHFPLGMTADAAYSERTVPLRSGDLLLLLTDGITEAMNNRREQFGEERLVEFVRSMDTASLSAGRIVNAIQEEVMAHAGGAAQHDDMTLVAVKVK